MQDVKIIKREFLKNEYKNFSLKKITFDNIFDRFDERQNFNILHSYYIEKYNLTNNKNKDTIDNYIVQDKIVRINSDELKIVDWKAPEMDYIKYDPKMKDTTIYEKSIYMNYPNSTIKSKSERMFEYFCENNENIKWFYKNGESYSEYFSIVYVDAVNHKWHFYHDFIVCDKDNKIWIIETKGGENAEGESKNIDIKVENKFEALKQYANKYNVNFGFVRDYDKNDSLYLCNTEYTEGMENENWNYVVRFFSNYLKYE